MPAQGLKATNMLEASAPSANLRISSRVLEAFSKEDARQKESDLRHLQNLLLYVPPQEALGKSLGS